jgi:hypothetical protein
VRGDAGSDTLSGGSGLDRADYTTRPVTNALGDGSI